MAAEVTGSAAEIEESATPSGDRDERSAWEHARRPSRGCTGGAPWVTTGGARRSWARREAAEGVA